MKDIFKLKYLPALLVAPILALCITGFAMASEAEGESFFDLFIHNISNSQDISDNATNVNSSNLDGYTSVRYGAASNDNKFNFNTYVNTSTGETVAYLNGIRSGMLADEDFINNTLVIPASVTDTKGVEYHVEGVESNSFDGGTVMPLSEDDVYRNHIKKIIVNGYSEDGTGGWFKKIKSFAFGNYYQYDSSSTITLESITLPDSVESWDTSAFNNDETLEIVKVQKYKNSQIVEEIGLPTSLNYIEENSFCNCYNLTFGTDGLKVPPNVTFIGYAAFYYCTNLSSVDFTQCTKLTSIHKQAFQHCSCNTFNHIKLPSTVTTLEDQAFVDCCYLNNIELNENLESIGQYCFAMTSQETTNAATLEYIFIPESVTLVNIGAFQNNQSIREIIVGMKKANNADINIGAFSNLPNLLSVTFLWNTPRLLNDGCFKTSPSTAYCGATKDIDVRFRPLIDSSEFGERSSNYWVVVDPDKKLDNIVPAGSRLMLIAAFDNDYYGNDLKKYLNEATGLFDNGTFEDKNKNLSNEVKYTVCITIPDVLKLEKTSGAILKTYAKTAGTTGRSKGIEFLYDSTNVHQITHEGKVLNRPADDGVLIINNNAIQVNSNNVLLVTSRNKVGSKSNPCVWGHGTGSSNPFQSTYDYLTADATQMDSLGQSNDSIDKPVMITNEPEDEIVDEDKPLFMAFGRGEDDVTIPNACCFFTKPGGEIEGQEAAGGKLSITNVSFGGKWTDNSVPDAERKTIDVGNTCQLGCVYNDGDLTMSGCIFQNSTGTWGGPTQKGDSYGGSCLFNFRTATVEGCIMENCSASYDGGAIMNVDTLYLTNSTIDNCTAGHYGGAIFNNIGDGGRGGSGGSALYVTGCTFTNNNASRGGAIYYCNGSTLELAGSLTFSGNTDENDACDVYVGTKMKSTEIVPLSLGAGFGCDSTITLAIQKAKNGLVVVSGGASAISSFASQNEAYELEASGSDITLKTVTTDYTLATDGNGKWVDEAGNEVKSFTAAGTTAPEAGQTITYTDVDGKSHTLTATANADYEFGECTLNGTTYTATFNAITPPEQKINDLTYKMKESINNRNADPNEALKTEIYGR